MIKKLYTIVCAISLITALPAFGMENNTYPCDNCQEEKTELTSIAFTTKTKNCDHIICQKCYNEIDKSQNGPIDILASTCACCPYMQRVNNKQCWQMKKSFCIGVEYNTAVSAKFFKENYPNRVLPNVTPETLAPQQSALPTIGTEKCTQCNIKNAKSIGGTAHTTYASPLLFSFPLPFQPAHHNLCKMCEHNIQNINLSPLQKLGCKHCFMQKNQAYAGCSNLRFWSEVALITAAAGIICYKSYQWWKGEEAQKKNTDNEQDLEKEEMQSAEQV